MSAIIKIELDEQTDELARLVNLITGLRNEPQMP